MASTIYLDNARGLDKQIRQRPALVEAIASAMGLLTYLVSTLYASALALQRVLLELDQVSPTELIRAMAGL